MRVSGSTLLAVAVAVAGCGGDDQQAAAPEPSRTPEPTTTATPAQERVKPARSARECLELWNAEVIPVSNYQVAASDFVAELARERRTPVQVAYQPPNCFVVARISGKRIAIFSAGKGRAPYSVPSAAS